MAIRDLLNRRAVILILFGLTAFGLYLRLRNLGELGFRWDEDITTLAVKGILEHGYPLFPSGMIYLRSGLFLYLLALSASLFGVDEFALRLPAVLFSTATIPLAYFFATRLFGPLVGLSVAALMSVSFWELEMARFARMYAPFAFFYLLTVFAFYHYYIEGKGEWRFITVLLAFLTITLHQLGFTLALFFLFPLLFREYRTVSRRLLLLNFALISTFFLFWGYVLSYFFRLPVRMHQASTALLAHQQTSDPSAFERLTAFALKILGRFDLPSFELLENLYRTAIPASVILTLACLALAAFYLASIRKVMGIDHLLVLLIALFCYLHQFNLVLLFFFIYLFIQNEGLLALRHRQMQGLSVAVVLVFSFWLVYGLLYSEPNQHVLSGESTHLRQTVKALFDYPRFRIVWGFVLERPIMSFMAAFGFLWSFQLAAQKPGQRNALFLILAFFVPLFAAGLFETRYELFRYVFHLDMLYFTLFVLGLAKWHAVIQLLFSRGKTLGTGHLASLNSNTHTRIVASGLLLFAALFIDLNPVKSWLSTERGYQESSTLYKWFDLDYYPDKKTPALFVKKRLTEDDIVIVLDAREQYNYIGKADYVIRTAMYETQTYLEGGRLRDLYIGTPLITSLQELKRILSENRDRRIWLVASSRRLRRTKAVSANIVTFIEGLTSRVVYIGKDHDHKVYLLNAHPKTNRQQ